MLLEATHPLDSACSPKNAKYETAGRGKMEIETVRRENVKRPETERAQAADFNDRGILTTTARGAQLVRSTFKIDERLSELASAVSPGALDQQAFCEEVTLLRPH